MPVSLTAADLDEQCRFTVEAQLAGYNCCNTLIRLRIFGSNGAILTGELFSQSGYSQTFDARQVCNDLPVESTFYLVDGSVTHRRAERDENRIEFPWN